MKNKLILMLSIILLVFGIIGIAAFIILSFSGENMAKWIMALIIAILLVIHGVIAITDYKSNL